MDKAQALAAALDRLSSKEAVALARAIEMQRALGAEKLPTDAILEKLRPLLQEARAVRVPTLRRLVCRGFEDFLADHEHEPRLPGLVPRSSIVPWWQGLQRFVGATIAGYETRFRTLIAENAAHRLAGFEVEVQHEAASWTRALLAELSRPKPDPALKRLMPRSLLLADLDEIAHLLGMAGELRAAIDTVTDHLLDEEKLDGRLILDLTPAAVTLAKQQFFKLSENQGIGSRYLALALLNRLAQPWQILRLGRALSWKPNDTLVRDTEFGVIGERLILDLQHLSRSILDAVGRRPPDLPELGRRLAHYMQECEGLLGEFGFRRDSPWGESILQTRMVVADALSRDFLDHVGEVVLRFMPLTHRPGMPRGYGEVPDPAYTPERQTIEAAIEAARFLLLLLQKGQRHGFSHAAREEIEALGTEIANRAEALVETLRRDPANLALVAQLEAAVLATETLFEDGRATLLTRRIRLARQSAG